MCHLAHGRIAMEWPSHLCQNQGKRRVRWDTAFEPPCCSHERLTMLRWSGANASSSLPPPSVSPRLHPDHTPASGSASQRPDASVLQRGGPLCGQESILQSSTSATRSCMVFPDDPCQDPGPGTTKKDLRDCHLPCGAAETQRSFWLAYQECTHHKPGPGCRPGNPMPPASFTSPTSQPESIYQAPAT